MPGGKEKSCVEAVLVETTLLASEVTEWRWSSWEAAAADGGKAIVDEVGVFVQKMKFPAMAQIENAIDSYKRYYCYC